jgi:hypothetical protein
VHMLLEEKLNARFPELSIVSSAEPVLHDDFDVYIIDNDFNGVECCADAVERARIANPASLIVSFSSHLNVPTLKRLIDHGCDAVFEKGRPEELENLIASVGTYFAGGHPGYAKAQPGRRTNGLVRELTTLVSSWNDRLTHLERDA